MLNPIDVESEGNAISTIFDVRYGTTCVFCPSGVLASHALCLNELNEEEELRRRQAGRNKERQVVARKTNTNKQWEYFIRQQQ